MVFSSIRIFTTPQHRGEVITLLRSVRDLARPSSGLLGCWISEDDYLYNHVRYMEQWETEEALQEHIRSDLYRRVLAAMELSRQQPEVRFYYCSESKGLEVIEAARCEAMQGESTPDTTEQIRSSHH